MCLISRGYELMMEKNVNRQIYKKPCGYFSRRWPEITWEGSKKTIAPMLLPITASNISFSCLYQSKVWLFPSKCLVFISSPFFSDPFSWREELKKKEYMSHVYIKCPLLDFAGVIDLPMMYLVIWDLSVPCSVMSDSLQPFTVACQIPLSLGFSRQEH